jgi:hypothetical protein
MTEFQSYILLGKSRKMAKTFRNLPPHYMVGISVEFIY